MKGFKEELYVYLFTRWIECKDVFCVRCWLDCFFPFEPILQLGVFRRMNFVCGFYPMTCFAFTAVHATFFFHHFFSTIIVKVWSTQRRIVAQLICHYVRAKPQTLP